MTREFVDKISKIDKLCPSFHVSMQSGCDETLRRMNRKYTAKEYLEAIDRLKGAFKDCAVTTDVMVGFPGETEEEFKKSYDTVTKSAFANIHVFQYSKRQGTPAAAMEDQVPSAVKAIRSAQMIKLGEELKYNFINKYMGKTMEVLFERQQEEYFEGFTANYIKVMAKGRDLSNKYINTLITDYKDGVCFGEIVGGELC